MLDIAKQKNDVSKLEKIFTAAMDSGDRYKKRGTFVLMSEMAGNIPWNDRFRANRLARTDQKEMPDLRVSHGMIQADNAVILPALFAGFSKVQVQVK
jgi:hypothetical protein